MQGGIELGLGIVDWEKDIGVFVGMMEGGGTGEGAVDIVADTVDCGGDERGDGDCPGGRVDEVTVTVVVVY